MKLQADELKISSSGAPSRRVFRARLMEIDPELDHDFLKAAAVSAQSPLPRLDLTPLLLHLSGFERGYVVLSGQGHCWVAVTGLLTDKWSWSSSGRVHCPTLRNDLLG